MDATGLQNSREAIHTGPPWSWMGVGAVMVLIVSVLAIALARDAGETTLPVVKAPVTESEVGTFEEDLVLHGRGLVDLPALTTEQPSNVAKAKDAAKATKVGGGGAWSAAITTCPGKFAVWGPGFYASKGLPTSC